MLYSTLLHIIIITLFHIIFSKNLLSVVDLQGLKYYS